MEAGWKEGESKGKGRGGNQSRLTYRVGSTIAKAWIILKTRTVVESHDVSVGGGAKQSLLDSSSTGGGGETLDKKD